MEVSLPEIEELRMAHIICILSEMRDFLQPDFNHHFQQMVGVFGVGVGLDCIYCWLPLGVGLYSAKIGMRKEPFTLSVEKSVSLLLVSSSPRPLNLRPCENQLLKAVLGSSLVVNLF